MRLTIIVVLAVALGGCAVQNSSDDVPRTLDEARAAAVAEQTTNAESSDGSESDDGAAQDQPQSSEDGQGPDAADNRDEVAADTPQDPHPGATTPGDAPSREPTDESDTPARAPSGEHPFRFEVELSMRCVRHGESMTIEVQTEPDASVAYHAVYAGEEGGAVPPYGEGHGGNGGDPADSEGRYSDTWVVGPDAPEGPARVDVAAAYYGEMTRMALEFEVADRASGTCGGAA